MPAPEHALEYSMQFQISMAVFKNLYSHIFCFDSQNWAFGDLYFVSIGISDPALDSAELSIKFWFRREVDNFPDRSIL